MEDPSGSVWLIAWLMAWLMAWPFLMGTLGPGEAVCTG